MASPLSTAWYIDMRIDVFSGDMASAGRQPAAARRRRGRTARWLVIDHPPPPAGAASASTYTGAWICTTLYLYTLINRRHHTLTPPNYVRAGDSFYFL